MKKVEILAVGTELLTGQIANTNAQYLSQKLPEIGLCAYFHSVCGDNPDRLFETLEIAEKRADVVILTGGLGPTQDDLTKNTVAKFLGKKLIFDEESGKMIKDYFVRQNKPFVESNYRQAYFPEGATILKNDYGTAPGCAAINDNGKVFIMLPGPPREMKPMYENQVVPYLTKLSGNPIISTFVELVGISESKAEDMILDLVPSNNPTFATYYKDGIMTIRISASGEDRENLMKDAVTKISEVFKDYIFSFTGERIEDTVVRILKEKNMTISTVESLTGGLIESLITSVSGASKVTGGSIVTYSNEMKSKLAFVPSEIIEKYGAVSSETAEGMATGGSKVFGSDITISVTGNAGPEAMEGKPVGRVYAGFCYSGKTVTKEYNFVGNRERIRMLTAVYSLFDAYKLIKY